jgi:hypothetical protein
MTYKGTVKNGMVVLPADAKLPDGTNVEVVPVAVAKAKPSVREFAGMLADLTADEWEQFQRAVQRRPLFGN